MSIVNPPMVTRAMLVPEQNVFIGAEPGSALVLHKTASGTSAEQIAHFFMTDSGKKSSHFVIGQDGEIVQCVNLIDGAGANCCVEAGYDPYWNPLLQKFGNLNLCTISIEHCDPSSANDTPLTDAQKASSFKLIKWLVDQYGFSKDDIKGHNSIDPINRARCPGNFPWDELFAYLQGGTSMTTTASGLPGGAKDNGKDTITFSNGCVMKLGFRAKYLEMAAAGLIPSDDMALENEHGSSPVEESNPAFWGGGGTAQVTRYFRLGYSPKAGVNVTYIGQEFLWYKNALASPPVLPPLPAGLSAEQKAAVTQLESSLATIEAALKVLGG